MSELTGAASGDISGLSPPCLECGMANQANPMKCLEAVSAPASMMPETPVETGEIFEAEVVRS